MIDLRELKDRLATRAEDIARELLPNGRRVGNEWYASGTKSPTGSAISVVVRGPKAGTVLFCLDGRGGSLIDLVMEVTGRSFKEAVETCAEMIGKPNVHLAGAGFGRSMRAHADRRSDERHDAELRRIRAARDIWTRTGGLAGTPAERYLLKRGLTGIGWPDTLHAQPHLAHPDGSSWPALVACLEDKHEHFRGIWRIWVTPDGEKAPVTTPKMGLGKAKGAFVRLGPWQGECIALTEGIETGLAVAKLVDGARCVLACLSTSGIVGVDLPVWAEDVAIYVDGDYPREGRDGEIVAGPGYQAGVKARDRLIEEGRHVSLVLPPPGMDFLDVLNLGERLAAG